MVSAQGPQGPPLCTGAGPGEGRTQVGWEELAAGAVQSASQQLGPERQAGWSGRCWHRLSAEGACRPELTLG